MFPSATEDLPLLLSSTTFEPRAPPELSQDTFTRPVCPQDRLLALWGKQQCSNSTSTDPRTATCWPSICNLLHRPNCTALKWSCRSCNTIPLLQCLHTGLGWLLQLHPAQPQLRFQPCFAGGRCLSAAVGHLWLTFSTQNVERRWCAAGERSQRQAQEHITKQLRFMFATGRCLGAAKAAVQWYEYLRRMVNLLCSNRGAVVGSKGHDSAGKCPPEKGFASRGEKIQQQTLGVELNLSTSYYNSSEASVIPLKYTCLSGNVTWNEDAEC